MVVQDPGFTQSYNRYSYAWNNPLKFTDPTGNTVTMQDLQREMDESSREWFAYARRQYTNMPYRSDWKSERQVIPGYEIQQFTYSTDMYNKIGDDEWQYSYSYVNKTQNELVFVGFGQDAAQGNGGWDNSELALEIGGGMYGALRAATTPGNQWLGNNGKYYNNSWGGNQYTGGRSGAFEAAKNYKWAGKAVLGVTAIIGVVETYHGYQADGGEFGYNAQSAAVQTVGGIGGGIGGAALGAKVGAGIGVWFGGVGAIPGAIIGGFVGGFVGGSWGSSAGQGAVNLYHRR